MAQGLIFTRTIAVDDHYLFTIKDEVANKGGSPVTLFPYALISRHGTPEVLGYYILHEGLIGVMGDQGEQRKPTRRWTTRSPKAGTSPMPGSASPTNIGPRRCCPTPTPKCGRASRPARLTASRPTRPIIWRSRRPSRRARPVPPTRGCSPAPRKSPSSASISSAASTAATTPRSKLNHFDLLIDWGWFYFITKPMFLAIDYFFHLVGNFGIAILIVTVLVKLLFFPLANKSYASMAKMKAVQPQMAMIKERYGDDKMKQQQAMMELYKKEQINPMAGCLPIAIQIPVFFSLYKVLFITIEMRHAPFYGWIHDLSAPDPTNIFTLGGLIPFDPTIMPMLGSFLHLGFWPAIMGVTMWVQMKLNPAPPDPTQQVIFNWMPIIFTFMLAKFPAGLVIYWAWNNSLSVAQQSVIMHKQRRQDSALGQSQGHLRQGEAQTAGGIASSAAT